MKKKSFIGACALLLAYGVFAYSQVDMDTAVFLAQNNIITKKTTTSDYRLDDKITRAEVMGIALKIRGVELVEGYTCKKYFTDTIQNNWQCRAAELAADAGIISGANAKARPQDSITRAEALAIIMNAGKIDRELTNQESASINASRFIFADTNISWQTKLITKAIFFKIFPAPTGSSWVKFSPNTTATRAEVFTFAKNTIDVRAIMSGEVTVK